MQHSLHIIIVAAGRGSRFGANLPKQFCQLGNAPVLMQTISRLRRTFPEANLKLVLSSDFVDFWADLCKKYGFESPEVVIGGDTRAESVKNAVNALQNIENEDIVMIHDGARPVIPSDMLLRLYDAMIAGAEAAIPVVPVTDSLRLLTTDGQSQVTDRSRLVAVQTPQAFRADKIIDAYLHAFSSSLTDDASVYQAFTNKAPLLVEGSPINIKITNPRDIDIASLYLNHE